MRSLLAFMVVVLTACGSDPTGVPQEFDPHLDFQVTLEASTSEQHIVVSVVDGELIVEGSVHTGSHGYTLTPVLDVDQGLELLVSIEQTGLGISIPAHYRYRARIDGLASGEYSLRVSHRMDPVDQEIPQFESAVVIP